MLELTKICVHALYFKKFSPNQEHTIQIQRSKNKNAAIEILNSKREVLKQGSEFPLSSKLKSLLFIPFYLPFYFAAAFALKLLITCILILKFFSNNIKSLLGRLEYQEIKVLHKCHSPEKRGAKYSSAMQGGLITGPFLDWTSMASCQSHLKLPIKFSE